MNGDPPTIYASFDSIALMPNGWTWIKPERIGTTPEECEAINRNEVAPERVKEIQKRSNAVARSLSVIPPVSERVH